MRISDWSSDVCSSDLDAELEIALSLLDLRLSRWSALQRVMRTLPLTVPLDQYQLSSGFGSRTDPLNGRKATHRGLDFRAAMKAQVYATAPGRVTHAGWARSEEHTSELQSLMRISYAVFCL